MEKHLQKRNLCVDDVPIIHEKLIAVARMCHGKFSQYENVSEYFKD